MEHIFRAYDIRGVYNDDLSPETMFKIGLALGNFTKEELNGNHIAVGSDIRTTSEIMRITLVSGLLASGMKITDLGTAPFGEVLFGGWKLEADVTAFVTASHLPPEWTGLKVYFGDGVGFPEESILELKRRVAEDTYGRVEWEGLQQLESRSFNSEYISFMNENFKLDKPVSAVLDCGNGSSCLTAPDIFKTLGIKTEFLFCEVDPLFPNRSSEPTPESLQKLSERVVEQGVSFGIGFDGDGDRGVIVDDKGRVLTADTVGMIIGIDMLNEKKGVILANVESSMGVEKILTPLGGDVRRIRVGHTFLTLEAKQQEAILGIERSGHMVIPEYFLFDDAMIIPLRIAEILSRSDKKLSEFVDDIPMFPKKTINFHVPDEYKFKVIAGLQNKFGDSYEKVNTMDGVRVDLEDGWALARCSNTEPTIRLTVEASSEDTLEKLAEEFQNALNSEIERIKNNSK
jgi:phosphomannomutase